MPHFNFKDKTGEKFKTNEGYWVEIIFYHNAGNCDVKFMENDLVVEGLEYTAIKNGRVKNPLHRTVEKIGYFGVGSHKAWDNENKKNTKPYVTWKGMLERCYSEKYREKYRTYKGVTVCEEWHNFQNFAAWYEGNYIEGWHLDKDIICPNCRIYSPETCAFVPQEINRLFKKYTNKNDSGVYERQGSYIAYVGKDKKSKYLGIFKSHEEASNTHKIAKQAYIKEVAKRYKEQLKDNVYKILLTY